MMVALLVIAASSILAAALWRWLVARRWIIARLVRVVADEIDSPEALAWEREMGARRRDAYDFLTTLAMHSEAWPGAAFSVSRTEDGWKARVDLAGESFEGAGPSATYALDAAAGVAFDVAEARFRCVDCNCAGRQ
jgi:hypothetical protein